MYAEQTPNASPSQAAASTKAAAHRPDHLTAAGTPVACGTAEPLVDAGRSVMPDEIGDRIGDGRIRDPRLLWNHGLPGTASRAAPLRRALGTGLLARGPAAAWRHGLIPARWTAAPGPSRNGAHDPLAAGDAPTPATEPHPGADTGRPPHAVRRRFELALAAEPVRVAGARRGITDHLRSWDLEQLAEDAGVITSELFTNALLYGESTTIAVRLAECRDHVLIAVMDDSPDAPQPARGQGVPEDQECGRGLLIVQCLASDWGVDPLPNGGKRVWATLALDR